MRQKWVNVGIAILFVAGFAIAQASGDLQVADDFNDGVIDLNKWDDSWNDSNRWMEEANERLESHADGTRNDSAALATKAVLPVAQDFRVQVDFNSTGCDLASVMVLAVYNDYTDSPGTPFDEWLVIGNGTSGDTRAWTAGKRLDDEFTYEVSEETSTSSGTFFIENQAGTFYLSYIGYGEQNAFATVTVEDWTNCTHVFVSLNCWSEYQVLHGDGSYFDDFSLTPEPATLSLLTLGSLALVRRRK